MSFHTIETVLLDANARDLGQIIATAPCDTSTLYVQSEDGELFTMATLQEETLSDGSKVYNLILHPA